MALLDHFFPDGGTGFGGSTSPTKACPLSRTTMAAGSHGKDMADGENGGAKKSVNTANMEHESGVVDRHSSIENVPEVVSHLRAKYQVRTDNVLKQRGKGIYRRHILHVGLKDISRRLPIVQPLQCVVAWLLLLREDTWSLICTTILTD